MTGRGPATRPTVEPRRWPTPDRSTTRWAAPTRRRPPGLVGRSGSDGRFRRRRRSRVRWVRCPPRWRCRRPSREPLAWRWGRRTGDRRNSRGRRARSPWPSTRPVRRPVWPMVPRAWPRPAVVRRQPTEIRWWLRTGTCRRRRPFDAGFRPRVIPRRFRPCRSRCAAPACPG